MRVLNAFKTVLLLVLLSAIFLGIGYMIGGQSGMLFAFLMSLVMNFGAYWFSDKIVLAMHKAQPIKRGDPSGVYEIVEGLCYRAKLPMSKVYLIPEGTPNAFATGRNPNNAAVAATEGIVRILNKKELCRVLAHEMAHIQNRDILISTIVATIASAIMYLAHMLQWVGMTGNSHGGREGGRGIHPVVMLVTIILAPLVATLVQAAVSRSREFMADESGAQISQDPEALAAALEKISNPALQKRFQKDDMLPDMQPAFAHLYIVNHFSDESIMRWFSTHPPVKERVKRLLSMKRS